MLDKNRYPFKRKRYGFGWVPVTWQGWLYLATQVSILLVTSTFLSRKPQQPTASQLMKLLIIVGLVLMNLVLVAYLAGPKPHWRWGKKDTDKSDEDF